MASTAGIDCAKPAHETEKMICGDMQLKMLDEMLFRIYTDLKSKLPAEDAEKLEAEQKQWIDQRNGFMCPDIYACLTTYNQRTMELRRRSDALTSLTPEQRRMLKQVQGLLVGMEDSWEVGLESDITELPDRGIRGLYLRSKMSPGALKRLLGVEPFVSGPHTAEQYDFSNKKAFGHYNREFVTLLKSWVDFFTKNPLALPLAQGFYDNQLMDLVPAYNRMYEYLKAPENAAWVEQVFNKYQKAVKEGTSPFRDGYQYPYIEFLEVAQKLERDEGFNVYELATAGPFWLRRRMDGTEEQLAEMAHLLLNTFESLGDVDL